jgi:Tfp pilus assembly protein PilO
LETQLEKLHAPDEIRRLYRKRHEKFLVLQNVSEQYKPFEERLAHINFSLPSAPVLPRVTLQGVSGSGFSIR